MNDLLSRDSMFPLRLLIVKLTSGWGAEGFFFPNKFYDNTAEQKGWGRGVGKGGGGGVRRKRKYLETNHSKE
jgi:hypothetical protein